MYGGSPLLVVGMETAPIRVGPRHVWLIVRLTTNKGLAGLGEASLGPVTRLDELDDFFRLVEGAHLSRSVSTALVLGTWRPVADSARRPP